jgi:hypothetical protein
MADHMTRGADAIAAQLDAEDPARGSLLDRANGSQCDFTTAPRLKV